MNLDPVDPVQIALSLSLPKEEITIPFARHLLRYCLIELRVDQDCAHDIELALSEACANVVDHSGIGDEYQVQVEVQDKVASIRVIDTGHGFDAEALSGGVAASESDERGRGLSLMNALVDQVKLESNPESGTVVRLDKQLQYRPDGPLSLSQVR